VRQTWRAAMLSTENLTRTAHCLNLALCTKAASGEAVEWYSGAGEYCPECGEALVLGDAAAPPSSPGPADAKPPASPAPANGTSAAASPPPRNATSAAAPAPPTAPKSAAGRGTTPPATSSPPNPVAAPRPARNGQAARTVRPRFIIPLRWFWIVAAVLAASAAIVYAARPDVALNRAPADSVTVCSVSSAPQLAADLVRGYAAKSATQAKRFILTDGKTCDVRFSMTPETPDDVIAHDAIVAVVNPLNPISRISETELRLIFSGSIHDWSELGIPPGAIVPLLPAAGTDETKALESSLFFGVSIDRGVRRGRSSAAVVREIMAPGRANLDAIGLVAFSQAGAAKVVPLTYLPMPGVLSIASGRYPYTLSIAVRAATGHSSAAAAGLLGYARSSEGAAIVVKNGLVPRKRL
jgi:hypothetical protein